MEEYNTITDSLSVNYVRARNILLSEPVHLTNFYDVENTIVLARTGKIYYGEEDEVLNEGDMLFIPPNKSVSIKFGEGPYQEYSYEDFLNSSDNLYKVNKEENPASVRIHNYSYVNLEAKAFDSVNFYSSLDIPPFVIKAQSGIGRMVDDVVLERMREMPGKDRLLKNLTERLGLEVFRYILEKNLFVEQLATNVTYFKDPRLISIFNYIKENLGGDLSNKVLARVANVSEDYVGQYFKMLTGINPQDYIEYQRMEEAVSLLRSTKKSIRDIGREVGYKDTAYFCRRFKMMFGIPAGKMRRRESLIESEE